MNDKPREAAVRGTVRSLAARIDEDHYRRARNCLEKRPSTVATLP